MTSKTIKYLVYGLSPVYIVVMLLGTMMVRGRALQDWVVLLVPSGRLRALLLYPLQHHHPVTFAKFLVVFDVIGNIFLFIPLGIIIFLVFHHVFRYPMKYVLFTTLLMGGILSIGIESVQSMVPNRVPSASDVLANTTGAVLGCSLAWFRQRYNKTSSVPKAEHGNLT